MYQPVHRRFTVREYYQMAEAGILQPKERVELIDGEVVQMSPQGSRHAACVARLTALFQRAAAGAAMLRVQLPVHLGDFSEPEPDVALVRPREDFYSERHPAPEDVLLLVEVADTSFTYDREVKAKVYAAAGVPEYWLVDLNRDVVVLYRKPAGGAYRAVSHCRRGESCSSAGIPGLAVAVEEMLGPPRTEN